MRLYDRYKAWGAKPMGRKCVWKIALFLLAAGMASAVVAGVALNQSSDTIDGLRVQALKNCQANNVQSFVQLDDLNESQRQLLTFDLTKLLGTPPERVGELRAAATANYQRRILGLAFQDCRTGDFLPPGVVPPRPKG